MSAEMCSSPSTRLRSHRDSLSGYYRMETSRGRPWNKSNRRLLLSRPIVEIANDDYRGDELVFRGGTCMHKIHAREPLRYSEGLDYVRSTGGGIGDKLRGSAQHARSLHLRIDEPRGANRLLPRRRHHGHFAARRRYESGRQRIRGIPGRRRRNPPTRRIRRGNPRTRLGRIG